MDFLQVKNGKIADEKGEPVYLRGTCVGGWMNMEDFINAYPGTESGIRRRICETLGEAKGRLFFERMLDCFFAEEDVRFIAETGANCVRLSLNYRHFEDDGEPFVYREEGFVRLDRAIDLCEKYGLYVILDMHAIPGWQNCHWHSDNERGASLFWEHGHFQERLKALWRKFAERYGDRSAVAGYDLMNEPSSGNPNGEHPFDFYENYKPDWPRVNQVYRELVGAIREVDQRHILFLEGDNYARRFDRMEAPFAENLAYSSHNYTPPGFGPGKYPGLYDSPSGKSYWDKFRHKRDFLSQQGSVFTREHNVPLWVGEFGSQYHGMEPGDRLRSMDDQLSVYDECGVHWTTWTYKDCGVMGWVTLDPESEYLQIVAPVQEMKRTLGAENFVAQYWDCPGRGKARELSDLILKTAGGLDYSANAYTFQYAALTGFAAAVLQPEYARRFAGMSEAEIDRVMQAFRLENCIRNMPYLEVLTKHFKNN